MTSWLRSSALVALAALAACTDAGVQPIQEEQIALVDDRLDLTGSICTSPPSEQVFPVKIMFIVDSSGSMQFTDPSDATASGCLGDCSGIGLPAAECAAVCGSADNPGRQMAVQRVIDRFKNNPAVSFSIIRFNGRVTVNGSSDSSGGGFTKDPAVLTDATSSLSQADITTDYQGALSTAFQVLQRDMIDSSPIDRARTKYVVVFLSDGFPDPICQKGCGNDTVDIGVVVDSWCDVPREEWCDNFNANAELCEQMEQWYPSMAEPCQAYNTNEDLIKKVNEIMDLGVQYGVGEITLHTAFLYVDTFPQALLDLFRMDRDAAEKLLEDMATAGGGFYRSFNAGQKIDFLDINYSSVSRPFGLTALYASNVNALPNVTGLLIDSDGDGLDDITEFHAKTLDYKRDSDGDGYGDRLEYDRRSAGFDPADPASPVRPCPANERVDRDGDGLLDCEEAVLGTDPKIVDTDRDRVPDGLEFGFNTKPLENDAQADVDFDGKKDREEVAIHADPRVADPRIHSDYAYHYDVRPQPDGPDLRSCLDFDVRRLRLVTTAQKGQAGTVGYNEIVLYFGEGPVDDPRDYGNFKGACVRAQYVSKLCPTQTGEEVSCGFKNPPSGKIALELEDFYDLPELIKRREQAITNPAVDPCVGVALP